MLYQLSYFRKKIDPGSASRSRRDGRALLKVYRAVNRIRTCDPVLGRNVLYQLSYYRLSEICCVTMDIVPFTNEGCLRFFYLFDDYFVQRKHIIQVVLG